MKKKTKLRKIKFNVGDKYHLGKGAFEVIEVGVEKLTLKWEDGAISQLPITTVNDAIQNKMFRDKNKITLSGTYNTSDSKENYYRTLGFLAKHGRIIARVTPKTEHNFVNKYIDIKDEYPYELDGYEVDTCLNTWSNVIRIIFSTKNISSLNMFSFPNSPVLGSGDHDMIINNLEWGFGLFEMGFGLGTNHNIEEIESNIPDEYIKYFKEGLVIVR